MSPSNKLPSSSSLFSFARRAARVVPPPAIFASRATCRPSLCSVPRLHSSLRPSLSTHDRSRSPQTLAPFPTSIAVAAELLAAVDSPSPVSAASIPRMGSFLASSSSDFAPNPAPSPSLQGRRRAGPPAAAPAHRAAPPPPFPADQPAGEARRHLRIPVRASPAPLPLRLAAPPCTAAARRRRARRARRRGRAPPRVKAPGWP